MNVLLLSPLPPPNGGIARWSETVIDYCYHNNDDVHVYSIDTGHKAKDIVNRTAWQHYAIAIKRVSEIVRDIKKLCTEYKMDVAHISTSGENGTIRDYFIIKALKKKNIKIIYHLHFGRFAEIKRTKTLEYKILSFLMKKVDSIIAMDPCTYSAIDDSYNKYFVPNPIKEEEFCISKSKTVVFLGYVVKTKGVEELLRAWQKIDCKKEWRLQIIGQADPNYLNFIKSEYTCENVSFLGEVSHSEAMQYLKNASIFVLPSYSEGFPYSVCEAMFSGKAIVATNVGAIPYMLEEKSGIVCNPKDAKSLEDALRLLINDNTFRYELGLNASKRAKRLFTVDVVINQYIDIWKKTTVIY